MGRKLGYRKEGRVFDISGIRKLGPVIRIKKSDKRLPHSNPEATPHNKLAVLPQCSKSKVMKLHQNDDTHDDGVQITFEGQYLPQTVSSYAGISSRLRYDINELWPTFEEELKVEMSKQHSRNWKKHRATTLKMWKRFIYSYTRFYQNVAKACDFCGISRSQYYKYRSLLPTLNLMLEIIEDRLIDEIEETTKKHSLLPNSIVERIFLLKTRRKDKYADTPTLVSATKIEVNIPNISGMREGEDTKIKVASFEDKASFNDNKTKEVNNIEVDNVKESITDNDRLSASTNPIKVSQVKE